MKCQEAWSVFITERAIIGLRDLESEWREEELMWAANIRADRRAEERRRNDREKAYNELLEEDRKRQEEEEEKEKAEAKKKKKHKSE